MVASRSRARDTAPPVLGWALGWAMLAYPSLEFELGLEVRILSEGRTFALEQRDEALDELGVELAVLGPLGAAPPSLPRGSSARDSLARPVIVCVGAADRQDARRQRDLLADQPRGIAATVDPLVVVEDRLGDGAVAVERADQFRPVLGMAS